MFYLFYYTLFLQSGLVPTPSFPSRFPSTNFDSFEFQRRTFNYTFEKPSHIKWIPINSMVVCFCPRSYKNRFIQAQLVIKYIYSNVSLVPCQNTYRYHFSCDLTGSVWYNVQLRNTKIEFQISKKNQLYIPDIDTIKITIWTKIRITNGLNHKGEREKKTQTFCQIVNIHKTYRRKAKIQKEKKNFETETIVQTNINPFFTQSHTHHR